MSGTPTNSEPDDTSDRPSESGSDASIEVATHLEPGWADKALMDEVQEAFTTTPKALSPRWLYDERGAALFDQITELDAYYPTEAERQLLEAHAGEIVAVSGVGTVVELGSGSSDKTRTLLDAFGAADQLERFIPFDVSDAMLRTAAGLLDKRYPGVQISPVVGDFNLHLDQLPSDDQRLVVFLGGTIGNFYPAERETFLKSLAGVLAEGEWFLLGADLVKDPVRILNAYDDDEGVTAKFILNVINVLNRELGATLPVESFEYVPSWDAEAERIDMRVRAKVQIQARVERLDLDVHFEAGEELRVEISSKFRPDQLAAEMAASGLTVRQQWIADGNEFGLFLAQRS